MYFLTPQANNAAPHFLYRPVLKGKNDHRMIRLLLFLFALQAGMVACRKENPNYAPALEQKLAGYEKLNLNRPQQDSMSRLIRRAADLAFPVFSSQGTALTNAQITQEKINMTFDCFADSMGTIKAAVFRKMTAREVNARMRSLD